MYLNQLSMGDYFHFCNDVWLLGEIPVEPFQLCRYVGRCTRFVNLVIHVAAEGTVIKRFTNPWQNDAEVVRVSPCKVCRDLWTVKRFCVGCCTL